MNANLRSLLIRVGISLIAVGAIVLALRDKLGDAILILKTEVNWIWFAVAFGIYFVALCLLSVRLKQVFKVQKIHVSFGESLYLSLIGLFFNLFLPSAVGGDIAKAYYAYKHSGKKIAATTSVLLDRLMGLVALIGMAFIAVMVFKDQLNDPRLDSVVYLFWGMFVFVGLFLGSKRFAKNFKFITTMIPEKWRQRISDVYHSIYGYKKHVGVMISCIALSLVGQSLFVIMHYFLSKSIGAEVDLSLFFVLIPVIAVITMAPSIGGLGVREAGIVYLFKKFMPSERALALSLLLDILIYGYSILAGAIFVFRGGLKMKNIHEMEKLQ